MGVRYRKQSETLYLVGGRTEKRISSFDSYGLRPGELGSLVREGGSLVAGRLLVESDESRVSQIGEVLADFRERPSVTLELFVLSVAQDKVDRVNEWLDSFKVAASYFENSAVPYIGAFGGGVAGANSADATRARGFNYRVDASALLDFVRESGDMRVELREQVQVLSGGKSRFSSGEVLTDTTYTTVPGTVGSDQLVSSISRRTVGLSLELEAVASGTNWFVSVVMEDSTLAGNQERSTKYQGERLIRDDNWFLLASFTRNTTETTRDGIKLFRGVPVLKSIFRKGGTVDGKRSVMVLCRPVRSVQVEAPS